MKVVLMGAKERETDKDRELVCEAMEKLSALYPGILMIALMTHMGVGKFVRDKCLEKDAAGNFKYQLIECSVRLYARHLSKAETAEIFIARNASAFEMGDILVYFAHPSRRGTTEDMLERFKAAGRPYKVFLPGEPVDFASFEMDSGVGFHS